MGDVHSFLNVESYKFHSFSAFTRYTMLRQSIDDILDDDHDKMIEQMQDEFPLLDSWAAPDMAMFVREEHEWTLGSGEIMNSCRELEVILVSLEQPLHSRKSKCEIALGLEQSNHRFIWVLREADKKMENEKFEEKDGKIELPKGFEERTKRRGMVVRNWAPQLEILGHSSAGVFLSHCGWNSCIESISMGVPLATWPIQYDQPYNAILVTNVLKIGTSVKSWAHQEELVTAKAVEKAVKTLMDTIEGEEMRQRAMELSNKIKNSISHGGVARKEMESFISDIIK
uniref:Zeatin O-glucosyltransferase-like n=1 Tax=Nicotiana sylvestris TaxID=4096 RepID=A0A1U7VCW6_NICSY|nr:PREDICTED: zeatin O-glucosyltransferase-like [Nicotiana sylvestris]